MIVLITGATVFIGQRLTNNLLTLDKNRIIFIVKDNNKTKLFEEKGFEPKYSCKEGIERTVNIYKTNKLI